MFPALPSGRRWRSGASPCSVTISKAAVFCPAIRSGLIEFTIAKLSRCPSSRTIRSASSKLPAIATTLAPYAKAWTNLPLAIFPAGRTTTQRIPARAAYAAADADVFPVEAQLNATAPRSTAFETVIVMPRSLNATMRSARSTVNHLRFRNARAEQRRQAAIADDDSGEPAWRFARAKFESPGQRTLPRFRHGTRGARGDLGADGSGRLHLSVLSRP